MFYHLFFPLADQIGFMRLFGYITFRSAYAAITALLICFLLGGWLIRQLTRWQLREHIRADGPATHLTKAGTPTMGGVLVVAAVVIPTLLWSALDTSYTWIILLCTVWMGLVGFLDDYLKTVRRYPKGLVARYKLLGQITLGLVVGVIMITWPPPPPEVASQTMIPFMKDTMLDFGLLYVPVVVLVITATSNAVNLTDGLDGLAIGLVGIAALAFTIMAYVTGRVDTAAYLNIAFLPGSGELTIFGMSLLGACLGFLWFNAHPAQVFMGDTGSMALGGALAGMALLLKKELLLIIVGGVFVIEAASVLIQVASYRWRGGRRVFRMAPLHHHFELKGWPESKVVIRFWILGIMLALFSLSTFKIR
ncbi:MAG: phospho-N-acetylmuramoyl-pentapeptide-transferase [bacterium]